MSFRLIRFFLAITLFSGVALQSGTQVAEAAAPLVVLDAGHGGYDPGAVGPTGYQEKTANLGIALRAKGALEALGYRVILTRSTDVALGPDLISDLQGRVDIANNNRADVFVSIHNNSAGAGARGTETYYYRNPETGASDPKSQALATLIQQETVKRVATSDRGAKGANFFVLRRTNMTAALLEGAFISDPGEEALLKTADFQQKLAEGVAAGIKAYFNQFGYTPSPFSRTVTLAPRARQSVRLKDMAGGITMSARVTSGSPIAVEKALYSTVNGSRGASTATGAPGPSQRWYLPEGYTGSGVQTAIAVQNPGTTTARVRLLFFCAARSRVVKDYLVGPKSRVIVNVNNVAPNESVATAVMSRVPVIAERQIIMDGDAATATGASAGKLAWYFSEGSTKSGFDTWLLLENEGQEVANATVTLMGTSGRHVSFSTPVGTQTRTTLRLRNYLSEEDFTIRVRSNKPIVAEREEYVNWGGKRNSHTSIGTPYTSAAWYFPEAVSGSGSSTKLLLWNPSRARARVLLTVVKDGGAVVRRTTGVDPNQRRSIDIGTVAGSSGAYSLSVTADQRLVAERTIYSNWGVSNSMGVRSLSKSWYFANASTTSGFDPWLLLYNPTSQRVVVNVELQR